ncbi:T-cell-specific guanine nucleotide triphosphate-binding protein 2-like [Mercenaria mercenaria]|uniref:T-cell-specific guanine nucleotide triphosphate-binding protein 2-like n=1 Tax=Mercenaria mercenaria TaxID=6596 RepID=UPI00234F49F8|nr:T-cell-specific guanine nucleotide triphosphate-binding protein 2-like [Mercenaria mercenaria]
MACFDGNKFSEEGLEGQRKKHLNEFKDFQKHIDIAVTGSSGAGKSSFINAIRDISTDDPGAAEVDVLECTNKLQEYLYPDNINFRIYDLPGVGTPHFQRSTYLYNVMFEKYDIFIILTETRFTSEDLWLAQQAEEKGKHFYFVRSKIDNDVWSNRRAHPRTHNEADLLNAIKEDLESNLKKFIRKDIFLIDNYETQLYEFGHLMSKLMQDSNEIKQDVLAFSPTCLSNEVIATGAFGNVSEAEDSSFVLAETVTNTDGNKYSGFVEKVKQLKSYYDEGGIKGLAEHFQTNLNEWKDVHIQNSRNREIWSRKVFIYQCYKGRKCR